MITVWQVLSVMFLIWLLVMLVFRPGRKEMFKLTEEDKQLLNQHVQFYQSLFPDEKERFEGRVEQFLSAIKITGIKTNVERGDKLLIGAAAIIPVFAFSKWEYTNLHEVLLYPAEFNDEFDQQGWDRNYAGMVGTGAMQHVMILSKNGLHYGFYANSSRNAAIHEFAHLIDKVDGAIDGVPEILLPRQFVQQWQQLMHTTIQQIENGHSGIDGYAATSQAEFFAVVTEYFFQRPEILQHYHPMVFEMLAKMFKSEMGRW